MVKKTTVRKRSVVARTPAEKFRDNVLVGYPEWVTWSRKLRRIFVCLPSYGVGKEALESMCEDFEWDFEKTSKLIDGNATFTISNPKQGQVVDFILSGNHTPTLAMSGATFNKVGSVDYDGSTTNLIQILVADDSASEIFYYSVAPIASDTTP